MKICSIPGCERRSEARGLCGKHYQSAVKLGTLDALPPFIDPGCKISGCGKSHEAKGYCSTHYEKLREHGDPLYSAQEARKAREKEKWVGDLRVCSCCGEFKGGENFYVYKDTGRLNTKCKKCISDKGKLRATPEGYRRSRLKRKYNLTPEEWQTMFETQGGVCAICKQPPNKGKPFHVDHCHATGTIRGLLCDGCNRGIGCLKESIPALRGAIEYLKRSDSGLE